MVIFLTYEKVLEYIFNIPKFTSKNNTAHTERLMELLGNPQDGFHVLHVAGSNGKGSVCAYLNSILLNFGFRTGLFTSPHLVDIRERFQINGCPCSVAQFFKGYEKVEAAVRQMHMEGLPHPTFFEYVFALGMVIYQEAAIEYAVIETGLGGRLDATNIIKEPLITIITAISLEHTKILGDTIEKIAAEKAGIIKSNTPVVFDGSESKASKVIIEEAKKRNVFYKKVDPDNIKILLNNHKGIAFCFGTGYDNTIIEIPFRAPYQVMNAALAFQSIKLLQERIMITDQAILNGLLSVSWPGRMEELRPGIFLDGAHNVAGIREFIKAVKIVTDKPSVLLFAMAFEKDYVGAIKLLCSFGQWEYIIITTVSGGRGAGSKELMQIFLNEHPMYELHGIKRETKVIYAAAVKDAYQQAIQNKAKNQYMFCAGSLYLAGEIMGLKNIRPHYDRVGCEVEYDRF